MLGDFVCSELLVPHIQGLVQFSTLVREASFGSEQRSKWEPTYPVMNLKEYLATGWLQMGHLCSLPPRNIKGEAQKDCGNQGMRSAGDLSSGCDVTVTILSTAAVIICTRKKDWNRGLLNKKRGVGLSWRGNERGMWDKCNKCIVYKYDTGQHQKVDRVFDGKKLPLVA